MAEVPFASTRGGAPLRLRSPRLPHLAAAVLFAVLVVGAASLAPGGGSAQGGDQGRLPSTYSDGPYGLRAFYLTCVALRMPVARWTRSLALLDSGRPALVAVVEDTSTCDLGPLRDWVEKGGRLLLGVVPSRPSRPLRTERLLGTFGLTTAAAPAGEVRFRGGLAGGELPADLPSPKEVFAAEAPGRVLAEVVGTGGARPWILSVPLGDGEVVAVADASFLGNARFAEPGSSVLAVRLVEAVARGDAAAFCETIHGYLEGDSPIAVLWRVLRDTAPGHFALQAGAAALLLLIAGAPRFGRVRRTAQPPRRSEYEYVDAVAGLLRRSGAWGEVSRLLAAGLRRRWNLRAERSGRREGPGRGAEIERRLALLGAAGDPERILRVFGDVERTLRTERGASPARG
ncbi:MAG: DUF4350 domain-containing protein [Planctomycetota bacterium]